MSIGVFNVLYIIRIENLLPLFGRKKDKDQEVEAAAWFMSCNVTLDPVEVEKAAGRDVCITVQYSTVKYSTGP